MSRCSPRKVIEQFTGSFVLSDEIEYALRKEGYTIMSSAKIPKRLTRAQYKAVMACITFVQAGEWPFDDIRPATLERASNVLMRNSL